ncbi:MAG: thiamine-phosphate kinase [Deltaproteobacteria bacterium]|nr:thiamine-phosphate kinase [Deltaproteobacteria bacterium]
MASEFERISSLNAIFGAPPAAVSLGIGDDAAIIDLGALEPHAGHLVWTIDACVEGVHFRREWLGWEDVGWRSLMAAASDLAAMAATPIGVLCAVALPDDVGDEALEAIARGQAAAAASLSTAIVGGNLSRGSELSISTTLLGACGRAVPRTGAQPGDLLILAGPVGLAAAGVRLLQQAVHHDEPDASAAVQAWRRPIARIADGVRLGAIATAQIDISDGLAQDASHIASASRVRIDLDADAIVGSELRAVCDRFGLDALQLALSGGEDYAVLATAASVPEGAMVIGRCSAGEGVWVGGATRVDQLGHDHFRGKP